MLVIITAIGVSALQVAIGVALGLSLRKQRRRRLADCQANLRETLAVEQPKAAAAASPAAPSEVEATVTVPAAAHDDGNILGREAIQRDGFKNCRKSRRRSFQFRQQVAPYQGGMLPGKASFREVECQDISPTGFSFLCSQLPDFDAVVVALGVAPRHTYLSAHIVSRCPLDDGPAPLYRIGCRFVGPVCQ